MRPESDIDIKLALDPEARVGWEIFGLGDDLTAVLGRPVDFGFKEGLKAHAKPSALRDAVIIYAER